MDCATCARLLEAQLLGNLVPQQAAALQAHLGSCSSCAAGLPWAPAAAVRERMAARLEALLAEPPEPRAPAGPARPVRLERWAWALAAAAALMLMCVLLPMRPAERTTARFTPQAGWVPPLEASRAAPSAASVPEAFLLALQHENGKLAWP